MTIPKNIVDKMEQINELMSEIDKWIDENLNVDGSKHNYRGYLSNGEYNHEDYYEFTDKPQGREQNDGEYCDQWECGDSGDWFQGYYYYPTEKGNYFYYFYET